MSNKEISSLFDVWKIIEKRRLEAYDYRGILYLEKDGGGVVQERYFKTFEAFQKEYPTLNIRGLMVDLSKRQDQ